MVEALGQPHCRVLLAVGCSSLASAYPACCVHVGMTDSQSSTPSRANRHGSHRRWMEPFSLAAFHKGRFPTVLSLRGGKTICLRGKRADRNAARCWAGNCPAPARALSCQRAFWLGRFLGPAFPALCCVTCSPSFCPSHSGQRAPPTSSLCS